MPFIAVATHDGQTDRLLREALGRDSARAIVATSGTELLSLLVNDALDAVILDSELPGPSSIELVRAARSMSLLPIVLLLRRHDAAFTARALDGGADEVVAATAPLSEISARLRVALDRGQAHVPPPLLVRTGDLVIDRAAQRIWKKRALLVLPKAEYAVLDALSTQLGRVVPHMLLWKTPGQRDGLNRRNELSDVIRRLRTRLEDDPKRPHYVITEWGRGYRLARLPIEDHRLGIPGG